MDKNRIKGKRKELEGELQQALGRAKDKAKDAPDDVRARIEREKGKRDAKRWLEDKGASR